MTKSQFNCIKGVAAIFAIIMLGLILASLTNARAQTTTTTVTVNTRVLNLTGPCSDITGLPGTTHTLSLIETVESATGITGPVGQWSAPDSKSLCDKLVDPVAAPN